MYNTVLPDKTICIIYYENILPWEASFWGVKAN